MESEVARIFPQARIKKIDTIDKINLADADIFVATSAVIKARNVKFALSGALYLDGALNRMDFRSSEKVFMILEGLCRFDHNRPC